ncbi:MAG: plastocyanin/azurin family copper-binding protein [Baekduia sp.]
MAVATGCSGGGPYRYALDSTIQVRLTEYRLSPQRIIVNAGEINLFAQNDGRLTHNLVVEEEGAEIGVEPKLYGRTPTLHPGELGTEVRPFRLKPGVYRLVCSIGNHENLGMHGELKVIPEGEDPRSR